VKIQVKKPGPSEFAEFLVDALPHLPERDVGRREGTPDEAMAAVGRAS